MSLENEQKTKSSSFLGKSALQTLISEAKSDRGRFEQKLRENSESLIEGPDLSNGQVLSSEKSEVLASSYTGAEETIEEVPKTKKHIKVGRVVLDYLEDRHSTSHQKSKKVGRPSKSKEDRGKQIPIHFSPQILEYIDRQCERDVSDRPRRSKFVRESIERVKEFEGRENNQAKILKIKLGNMDKCLKKYADLHSEARGATSLERSLGEIEDCVKEIRIIDHILLFDKATIKRVLTHEEVRTLEFALRFNTETSI